MKNRMWPRPRIDWRISLNTRRRWLFLTPSLESATNKTRESAPPLIKQIWNFLEEQLELADEREMTVMVSGFWMNHA